MNATPYSDCGITYIAFGDRFQEEARRSIDSVRRQVPGLPIAVIADSPWTTDPIPDFFVERPMVRTFASKTDYLFEATPFQRTLYLDTDTVLARDCRPLFDLLDDYDMGLRFVGPDTRGETRYLFHPHPHSAVLLFSKSEAAGRVFEEWKKNYDTALANDSGKGASGPSADSELATAIARSGARIVPLASHVLWNAVEPEVLYAPPVICHGRFPDIERHAACLQARWRDRNANDPLQSVWLPNVRGLLPNGMRRSDPFLALSLAWQRLCNTLAARKRTET